MSFKAVNWTPNEMIGEAKTDQMAENADWLYRNTPRAIYTLPGGLVRTEGVKIAAGRVIIAKKNTDDSNATVRFGNFFAVNCEPIVTTGIVTDDQVRTFATISGIGQLQPDNRGFNVGVNIAAEAKENDKILRSFYVSWQAMGY
jgi:hypothetical protein